MSKIIQFPIQKKKKEPKKPTLYIVGSKCRGTPTLDTGSLGERIARIRKSIERLNSTIEHLKGEKDERL